MKIDIHVKDLELALELEKYLGPVDSSDGVYSFMDRSTNVFMTIPRELRDKPIEVKDSVTGEIISPARPEQYGGVTC